MSAILCGKQRDIRHVIIDITSTAINRCKKLYLGGGKLTANCSLHGFGVAAQNSPIDRDVHEAQMLR